MTAIDPIPQGDDGYKPEAVTTKLGRIPFNHIDEEPADIAFRDDEELTDAAIKPLAEDVAVNGPTTPLLHAVAADVQQRPLSGEGRQRAIIRLKRLGVPNDEIARCVGVSKQTVERDLALTSSGCFLDRIRQRNIPAIYAARPN